MKNIKNKIRVVSFVLLTTYSLFFLIGSLFAPICAYLKNYELSAQLTSVFLYSCHHQPDRTFWILGYPMALCARCMGVYLSTTVFSIICIFKNLKIEKKAILVLGFIALIDICINYGVVFERRHTGNIPRFFVGLIIGYLLIIGIYKIFDKERTK